MVHTAHRSNMVLYMPTSKSIIERKGKTRSHLQEGPIDLPQLPRVVQVQGCQQAVVGELEGAEDDWVQTELDNANFDMDCKHK